jgi:hypothetical protein
VVGDLAADGRCPSVAWDFGNGEVMLTQAGDCEPGAETGHFEVAYVYRTAGAFEASARLLASDADPSPAVQVLVGGASATPPRLAALPGPTVILATAAPEQPTVSAAATEPPSAPASTEQAPVGAERETPASLPGEAPPAGSGRVLPADLYYVDSASGALLRMASSGAAPERVLGGDGPITGYAVSPAGYIASVSGGTLSVDIPGRTPITVAGAGASSPAWSRDSRLLAFAADGLRVFDVVTGATEQLHASGSPLAWSTDASQLLVRGADGRPAVVDGRDGRTLDLPLPTTVVAGWLPDRPVGWVAGAGLHLVTTADPITLGGVIEERSSVAAASVRPDLHLLALADRGDGLRGYDVDLEAPSLDVRSIGPALPTTPGGGYSWAPDGRTVAVADRDGVGLMDPFTGARLSLVGRAARLPQWVLPTR